VIDNKKLLELAPQLPVDEAFKIADKVLANVIKGLIESISAHSLVNPDFADFKTIVKRGGVAGVGIGESDAPNRAEEAVRNALRSPLLDVDCTGATGTLIHVTGDSRLTLEEVNRVREIVAEMMNNNAQVILGAGVNPELDGKIRVTLMMTGVGPPQIARGFGSIAPQLFNLEPYSEPEKKLHVDLGLYQLENSEP
jgi:cell division protein FtsZ